MSWRVSVVGMTGLVLASAVWADAESGLRIWEALLDAPPTIPHSDARQTALQALDDWIARPDSERSPELVAYYRRAAERVIALLESERPKKGIRYFQLYSSSAIIQTPTCAFAFDLDQGPNEDPRKTPEEEEVPFCLTDEQVARLAECIDYSFHTHEHRDHIDREITQALMERDKTVIVTESDKRVWADEPWADKLVTLTQTMNRPHDVGDLKVFVLWDHQWNNPEHTSGTPCNAYIVTTPEGITVATKGDINCGLRYYGWLNALAERGCTIDLMVGSALYWRGPNLTRQIDALLAPIWAPGHNWEFTHRPEGEPKGNAAPFTWAYAHLSHAAKQGSTIVLSWGEYFDLPAPLERKEAGNR